MVLDWKDYVDNLPAEVVRDVEQVADAIVNTQSQSEKFRLLSSLFNQMFGTSLYSWSGAPPRLATLEDIERVY